ncbi:predicted protein [Phaeodactylum tricornutum CCAP 1055/1]|uniref:Uncharacterized protein n=1 Tax=Phaeodactylum tricornutum (strain CCAP 1055/1) TaxID=556484 RepID=B7FS65_PHATC|nr:predicted protein [Phaeodactylum tricornutum CCAP 1055/1]EEC50741.1 predicted protein [Phaeodactylum tricornutum CCAP 1055/1]|eukprot:XP_002177927.1 predicted protein [Phaeodactylum tricornutum CCAP 1055/1]
MIRSRDVVAIVAIVLLSRMAWRDPAESSLTVTTFLSFYVPWQEDRGRGAAAPTLLDVDGDGVSEALVTIVQTTTGDVANGNAWTIQILDLKPAANTDQTHLAPFSPKLMYASSSMSMEDTHMSPLMITTGHVLSEAHVEAKPNGSDNPSKQNSGGDRTRHYYCGIDWHEASDKCGKHCPKGQADECPPGEKCYADTPCDASADEQHRSILDEKDMYQTPVGSVPTVFVLWNDGSVSAHSLTGEISAGAKGLELTHLWTRNVYREKNRTLTDWEDTTLNFFNALDAGDAHGKLVFTGYIDFQTPDDDIESAKIAVALDAKTGQTQWEFFVPDDGEVLDDEAPLLLPLKRGSTSPARRRSQIPSLVALHESRGVANCLHAYRRSLLTTGVLPHSYWSNDDATVTAVHFTHQKMPAEAKLKGKDKLKPKMGGGLSKGITIKPKQTLSAKLLPTKKRRRKRLPHFGRPNVLVLHNQHGIHVRSIKNGMSLCHVSLSDDTLYADLNHDGVLDSVQVLVGGHADNLEDSTDDGYKFVSQLVKRVGDLGQEDAKVEIASRNRVRSRLCHAMALSGIPTKEELFSVSLCSNKDDRDESIAGSPPLAIESLNGKGYDLIVALSNGQISRFRGVSGSRVWQISGRRFEDFPTWDDTTLVSIDRIEAEFAQPATRPILIAGENSMALLASRKGTVLATASFPQPSMRKPLLMDFNGDGTTDVMVMTQDAIWGYRVVVKTGTSILFRITVGLLLVAMMMAVLRNRFSPQPGKRSTDA